MGKSRKRDRREAKRELSGIVDHFQLVSDRCGPRWNEAFKELKELDVPFVKFASPDFDCRECPQFLNCLFKRHFESNSKWRFEWFEDEYSVYNTENPPENSDPESPEKKGKP